MATNGIFSRRVITLRLFRYQLVASERTYKARPTMRRHRPPFTPEWNSGAGAASHGGPQIFTFKLDALETRFSFPILLTDKAFRSV